MQSKYRLIASLAIGIGMLLNALPAHAATSFVQDGAALFSPGTTSALESKIGAFNAQTGKQIVVVTVADLGGDTLQSAAQKVFSQQAINGVLIFIAKSDRKDIIVAGRATSAFFPAETTRSIRESMESQFRLGDYDGGITTAVNGTLDVFRAHMSNAPNAAQPRGYAYPATTGRNYVQNQSGGHLSMIWWLIIIAVGFLVLRSIMRAMSGPRYMGGPGPGGVPMSGPGMGGPGYGGGYGYGGGGGGFWSGLLGGLGGAWLGNEMFRGNSGGSIVDPNAGGNVVAGDQGGGWGGGDSAGWGSDGGQADMGNSSAGDFSGGGFGGGDAGGGFGGGGDSGGGW
ncbi:MAG: TPM domain-containing protein [Candidatus Eremiobacteraeota bacterium]|nr:TPM domain-containing protein [Candidatus Eremiobacteraeota bacterium]